MALFNIFKKKEPRKVPSEPRSKKPEKEPRKISSEPQGKKPKKKPRKVPSEPRSKKPEKKPAEKKIKRETGLGKPPKPKKTSKIAYRVLKGPHVTEKATDLTKENQYVFKVFSGVNKFEIKKAVEDLYGVDVASVKITKVLRKKRRLGRIEGWRKGYKKAVVKLQEGQKIEVLPR